MEIDNTGLTIIASSPLAVKFLGPTIDYMGAGMKNFVAKQVDTVRAILENAAQKSGASIHEDRVLSARVLLKTINEGGFCEDRLAVEYFGGLLASARGEDAANDAALPLVNIVSQLTTSQLRLHYAIYSGVARKPENSYPARKQRFGEGIGAWCDRRYLEPALNVSWDEKHALTSNLIWLERAGLIQSWEVIDGGRVSRQFSFRGMVNRRRKEMVQTISEKTGIWGIAIELAQTGVDLFLGAHGLGGMLLAEFVEDGAEFEPVEPVSNGMEHCFLIRKRDHVAERLKELREHMEFQAARDSKELVNNKIDEFRRGLEREQEKERRDREFRLG